MYIISFIDTETGNVVTKLVKSLTSKNITFVEKICGYVNYLYEEALKILSTDISSRYRTYYKKKRNGNLRRIDVPDDDLKKYMREVNYIFTNRFNFLFPECVGAYVKHRPVKQSAEKHIGAYAIFKFDIENFFGSCTLEKIMDSLSMIYPFSLIDSCKLETIVKACMINYDEEYRLPQGAPSSPLLSNLAMIPTDMFFTNFFKFTYTRFSDDMTFSTKDRATYSTFHSLEMAVTQYFLRNGIQINESKTKFLKAYQGNPRVLGISVGKEKMTIGNKNKQIIKAQIWSFLQDTKAGKIWSKKAVEQLEGRISQFKYIEPSFISSIIERYERKTNVNYKASVKNILYSK